MADGAIAYAGRKKKRAIALGGGGPAAGFLIGSLSALEEAGITFDVWSLSCIGAWVGIYYNQLPDSKRSTGAESRASRTHEFFRQHAFRDADSYRGFPVNKAFAPNLRAYWEAWLTHCLNPQTYVDMFSVKNELGDVAAGWMRFLTTPAMWWRESDVNLHVLNNIMAVHPLSRFYASLAYLSSINGLTNIYFKESTFLEHIDIGKLDVVGDKDLDRKSGTELREVFENFDPDKVAQERKDMPEIYHNAWRLADTAQKVTGELRLFNNKWVEYWKTRERKRPDYLPITRPSLCACSALPYIEQTVQIPNDDGHHYSEGALIDTVNFANLVEDHPDLDEIWVCRIVDDHQVHRPSNLHDSLGNLCEQFAAEVGEDDVKLFKSHLRKSAGRIPRVVEILLPENTKINYRWDRDNLATGFKEGRNAVHTLIEGDDTLVSATTTNPAWT
jgi:predicted acylesterase/phospholipase RssA